MGSYATTVDEKNEGDFKLFYADRGGRCNVILIP